MVILCLKGSGQFLAKECAQVQVNCLEYKAYTGKGAVRKTGPSCSKLTMSLVNDSLKFKSSDTQIC